MNNTTLAAASAALLVATAPAFAGVVTIDFEQAPSFASVGNTYAASGVTFGLDALGLQNDALGPYFSNAPSSQGVMFVVGSDNAMNVAGPFSAIDFFYSSAADVLDGVQVWSGLNGTGSLLASFNLSNNASLGCTDTPYCHWDRLSASLAGDARSVTFSAGAQAAAFDNISVVPEPASLMLAALGLGALALRRRAQ